ncbi:hypothetical protein D3C71_1530440 [compost metagenome]
MIKRAGIGLHAKPRHHRPRALVAHRRERHDFIQPDLFEPNAQCRFSGFAGIATPPKRLRQTPAHFDPRRERQHRRHGLDTDKADERRHTGRFNGPKPPAMLVNARRQPSGQRIAFLCRQRQQELGHARIRVHCRERLAVIRAPLPQHQSRCFYFQR